MKKLLVIVAFVVSILQATTPTYENVVKLYIATFDRCPEWEGVDYWVNKSNLSLEEIAASFMQQPEAREKYYPDNIIHVDEFVDTVYLNVLRRYPKQAGKDYWGNFIFEDSKTNIPLFILAVINGAQGEDAEFLEKRTREALADIWDLLPHYDAAYVTIVNGAKYAGIREINFYDTHLNLLEEWKGWMANGSNASMTFAIKKCNVFIHIAILFDNMGATRRTGVDLGYIECNKNYTFRVVTPWWEY